MCIPSSFIHFISASGILGSMSIAVPSAGSFERGRFVAQLSGLSLRSRLGSCRDIMNDVSSGLVSRSEVKSDGPVIGKGKGGSAPR
jgi:hypothetical protein